MRQMKSNNFAGIPKGHKSPLLQLHRFKFFEVPLSEVPFHSGPSLPGLDRADGQDDSSVDFIEQLCSSGINSRQSA